MDAREAEARVRACYATWSGSYYDEYYGGKASYPPVHLPLLKGLLRDAGARRVLDAGCGPASFLRELDADSGLDLYGFDLTPEMVDEARRVLAPRGVPPAHLWQGSVLDTASFRPPEGARGYDAAVCVGVLPHVPAGSEGSIFANLRGALRDGGLAVVEARNELFALFTLNRYSHRFFLEGLLRLEALKQRRPKDAVRIDDAVRALESRFRMDLPPVRKGRAGEPGYDEVPSRTHNPLVLRSQFEVAGFRDVRLLFYHYHALPPQLEAAVPDVFRAESLGLEDPHDWRGHFMASAFLLAGSKA